MPRRVNRSDASSVRCDSRRAFALWPLYVALQGLFPKETITWCTWKLPCLASQGSVMMLPHTHSSIFWSFRRTFDQRLCYLRESMVAQQTKQGRWPDLKKLLVLDLGCNAGAPVGFLSVHAEEGGTGRPRWVQASKRLFLEYVFNVLKYLFTKFLLVYAKSCAEFFYFGLRKVLCRKSMYSGVKLCAPRTSLLFSHSVLEHSQSSCTVSLKWVRQGKAGKDAKCGLG